MEKIIGLIEELWPDHGYVSAIGVASPGPVNPYLGKVIAAPNVPGWSNINLKDELETYFKVPVAVGNDANFAAIGEWKYGAGRGHHDLIYLTVSTGIGGGIIVNDSLVLGYKGLASEMGHITLLPNGPLCACGKRGHLECLSSGPAIARWAMEKIRDGQLSTLSEIPSFTCKEVAQAAKNGDQLAIEAFENAGYYLGMGIANFIHIFNPTAVILGGGVSLSGDLILKPTMNSINEFVIDREYLTDFVLTLSHLGDEAGLIGALAAIQIEFS